MEEEETVKTEDTGQTVEEEEVEKEGMNRSHDEGMKDVEMRRGRKWERGRWRRKRWRRWKLRKIGEKWRKESRVDGEIKECKEEERGKGDE